jgi:hypothetical protein
MYWPTGILRPIYCVKKIPVLDAQMIWLQKNLKMREPGYTHHCTVPWTDRKNPMFYWDNLCANAVELFGLPGDRYITDISEQSMTWSFRSDQDAVLFRLKFSEALA